MPPEESGNRGKLRKGVCVFGAVGVSRGCEAARRLVGGAPRRSKQEGSNALYGKEQTMRDVLKITVVLLACMVLVVGCGDKDEEKGKGSPAEKGGGTGGGLMAPAAAATPKAAVLAMFKALEAADTDAFAACFDATAEDKGALKEVGAMMAKLVAFNKAGIKCYGKEEWEKAGGGKGGSSMPTADEIDKKTECKAEGDKATCTIEGQKEPMNLVKKDGKWLIEPDEKMLPADPAERAKTIKRMKVMAGVVDGPMKKIGQPGVTAEQVKKEFFAGLMAAMMGGAPKEPTPKLPE